MSKQVIGIDAGSYAFTPGTTGVGTVNISALAKVLRVEQILYIQNVTKEEAIYDPYTTGKGYTAFSSSASSTVLTLEFDTSIHSSGDKLQIFIEGGEPDIVGTGRTFRDEFFNLDNWDTIQTGTGMTVSQGGVLNGSRYLNIATGTNTNQETILQSKKYFNMPLAMQMAVSMSQRIANQELKVMLVEVDDAGNLVTETSIASAPDFNDARNGVGFKWDSTVATTVNRMARAFGKSQYANVAMATQTTTVATGTGPNFLPVGIHEIMVDSESLVWSSSSQDVFTAKNAPSRINQSALDSSRKYKVRICAKNLGTAPASTTDMRIHFIRVEENVRMSVDFRKEGFSTDVQTSIPVAVVNTTAVSGTVTANNNAGTAAHSAAASGNPVQQGGVVRTANDTTLVAGDMCAIQMTTSMQQVIKDFAPAELDWQYYSAVSNTTAVTAKAAPGAGLRNYMTGLVLSNQNGTNDGLVRIQDGTGGATLFQTYVPAKGTIIVTFPTPIKFTVNTLVSMQQQLGTNPTIETNIQGYVGI